LRFFFFRGAFMALLEMLQEYSTDEKFREILTKHTLALKPQSAGLGTGSFESYRVKHRLNNHV
jgi:hypothetical protein